MIPKEKAKELVDKYYKLNDSNYTEEATIHTSKQCALICVEELIVHGDYIQHWQEVKKEINKL